MLQVGSEARASVQPTRVGVGIPVFHYAVLYLLSPWMYTIG